MKCSSCQKATYLIWAHNAGIDTHRWEDTGDEKDCTCGVMLICTKCDAPLLKAHGFIVLDAACFGSSHSTLQ